MNIGVQFANDAQALMQTKNGQILYKELQELKSEIAGIVLDGDPLSHQRPINPMSSLLQGLVRKGLSNGTIHSTTITRLWIQSGGIAEEAPISYEMIAREHAGKCGDGWGKPRVRLRNARYRGQAPVVRSLIRPTISDKTRDAFHRLIVQNKNYNKPMSTNLHHHAFSVVHDEGGEEEHKEEASESNQSRHEYDSDYQQSDAELTHMVEMPGVEETPVAAAPDPMSPISAARTAAARFTTFVSRQIGTPAQIILQGQLNRLGR